MPRRRYPRLLEQLLASEAKAGVLSASLLAGLLGLIWVRASLDRAGA